MSKQSNLLFILRVTTLGKSCTNEIHMMCALIVRMMRTKTTPRSKIPTVIIRASSKSSKLGRFPPVPMRKTTSRKEKEYFESVLDELRRRSLLSSEEGLSFVEREQKAFEEVYRSHHLSVRDDDDKRRRVSSSSSSLYVTLKNENLYNLYAMETMACSTTSGMNTLFNDEDKDNKNECAEEDFVFFDQLSIGLFMAQDSHGSSFTRNAASLRAKVEPIFSEKSWDTFAERLEKTCSEGVLPGMEMEGEVGDDDIFEIGRKKKYYNPPIALIYETVARFQPPRGKCGKTEEERERRKPSDELLQFCTKRVKQLSPADVGYKYGVRATFAGVDPREPDVVRAKEHALRFVVLETETAYTFALASYAPDTSEAHSVVKSSLAWAQKPANYSSGARFEVARALVNTVAATLASPKSSTKLSEITFLDPFCGSGTLCVAAKQLGFGNVIGSDATGHLIEKSQRNARWFFDTASGAQAVPSEQASSSGSPFPRFQQANAFIRTSFTSDPSKIVVVSNLPFGRNVDFVAPPPGDECRSSSSSSSTTSHLQLALETLKPLARTHAFISGVPIGEEMIKLGYENVSQIALDRRGKMFIAISFSNDDDTIIKVSDEHVWFTVEEALLFDEIRQANARKRAAMRKNDEKEEDEKVIEIARRNPNVLKVIVDLSYEHDSARALRSVAKQLCEITSVGKKSKGDLRVTFASFAGDIKYESETFFNADTWSAHVEMLPDPAEECDVVACQEEGQTKNNIIYLSPDAETPLSLSELRDPSNIFVVGGIVDLKTRGMKTSKKKASSLGVQSRKLPVKTLRPDQTHDVLNIDTVVKILRSAWTMDEERGEDDDDEKKGGFHRAFDEVLPKRQGKEKPKRLKRLS